MLTICLGIAIWMISKGRNQVDIPGGLVLFGIAIIFDAVILIGILDAILDVYRGVPCG